MPVDYIMDTGAVGLRLRDLAGQRGTSLAALSRLIGKNATYLQQFVTRGSPRRLEERDRGMLARFLGVDERELGAPGGERGGGATASAQWIEVPRLAVEASAGPGAFAQLDGIETSAGSLCFSARWLRARGWEPARLSAIAVRGDSMEPTLSDGDEILVERGVLHGGEGLHVVRHEGVVLVKRLARGAAGLLLVSDNPAYAPIACRPGEIELVGRVVWKGGAV